MHLFCLCVCVCLCACANVLISMLIAKKNGVNMCECVGTCMTECFICLSSPPLLHPYPGRLTFLAFLHAVAFSSAAGLTLGRARLTQNLSEGETWTPPGRHARFSHSIRRLNQTASSSQLTVPLSLCTSRLSVLLSRMTHTVSFKGKL